MKLLVGLGNPGLDYQNTRHNIGFLVLEELAHRWQVQSWGKKFQSLTADGWFHGEHVFLLKPLTYMNLSGQAVASAMQFYQFPPADLLIVTDDVALPLGKLRIRRGGSAGGHNGLKSIIQHLGTDTFPRLRIGVGRGDERHDLSNHVLGRFLPEERELIMMAVLRAVSAIEMFLIDGIERVMNAFNAATDSQQDPGSA